MTAPTTCPTHGTALSAEAPHCPVCVPLAPALGSPSAAPLAPWELPATASPAPFAQSGAYGPPPAGYGAPPPAGWPAQNQMMPPVGYRVEPRTAPYAAWWQRALALLLDWLITQAAAFVAGMVLGVLAAMTADDVPSSLDQIESAGQTVGVLAAMTAWIILSAITGITGKSPGKAALGIQLVSLETREPVGAVVAVARWFAHLLDWLSLGIGWLLPLWDDRRQTLADKVVTSVVIRTR